MKHALLIGLLLVAGLARADELGEANRLLAAKSYDRAFPIYQKLAEAGNPEAQLRLGEMYWFGDGTAPDLARAKQWFERSAAAGNKDGAASLASLQRRETHGAEIVYWTTTYQGEDLVSGKFDCKRPDFPARSTTKADVTAVNDQILAWHQCYNGFVANLNDALPPGKRIPPEVVDMMTPSEGAQAQRHLDTVYSRLIKKAQLDAAALDTQEAAWRKATETYVMDEAERRKGMTGHFLDDQRQQNDWNMQHQAPPPPPPPPPPPSRR